MGEHHRAPAHGKEARAGQGQPQKEKWWLGSRRLSFASQKIKRKDMRNLTMDLLCPPKYILPTRKVMLYRGAGGGAS